MAFQSRRSSERLRGGRRGAERESILGLSGWLFADLLLAIAVIFLVVQQSGDTRNADELAAENAELKAEIDRLNQRIDDLTPKGDAPPAEEQGLIASEAEQLVVTVRGGFRASSRQSMARALERADIKKGSKASTWAELTAGNYRMGFILWYADTADKSRVSAKTSLDDVTSFFLEQGLVGREQLGTSKDLANFPHNSGNSWPDLGPNDIRFRIFMFKTAK